MIRLKDLEVRAGSFRLHIEDVIVPRGEYLAVLGPTGAGKSVLLEVIAGLRRPSAGSIRFGDREVTEDPPERRRVGFVYQDYALFPHLDVAGNIAFGLGPRADAARVRGLASLLKIAELLPRRTQGLSGGEQQRVAIARALAVEPRVLLLDEPLSALDGQTRLDLRGELKNLHRRLGTTVMHVTHDLDEAIALGDRLMVLMDGAVRQVGDPLQVLRRPVDGRVARLLGAVNVFGCDRVEVVRAGSTGDELKLRVTLKDGPRIWAFPDSTCTQPASPDARVAWVAVVRPEDIGLCTKGSACHGEEPAPDALENRLQGVVRDVTCHSVYASVEVEVPPVFVVRLLRPQVDISGVEVGARVALRFPASAVHVCPEA